MNQRIFELAKTSGAWDYFNDGDKSAIMDQQALQNFAMAVVKECAQVCLAQRNPFNLNYKPSEKFAQALKQHFGVE